ncbi:hypothetical protein [Paratractidigestivibacter sp.]|nr:hypothetical protein [Paratractidigestivibacter sp.]
MAEYEGLRMEAARAKLYEKVAFAEKDVAEGRVSDAVDTVAQLKARYDL